MEKLPIAAACLVLCACGTAPVTSTNSPPIVATAQPIPSASSHAATPDDSVDAQLRLLADPNLRSSAVERLAQHLEEAVNTPAPTPQPTLDKIVPALTNAYVQGGLGHSQQSEVLRVLAASKDRRAEAAWIKAVRQYEPGVSELELKYGAQAIAASGVRASEAVDALLASFLRLQAGTEAGLTIYKDYRDAMIAVSSPSWETALVSALNRPMTLVSSGSGPEQILQYRNEQFWQVTAAEILGNLKSGKARRPLFYCVLDPAKGDIAATAVLALVKDGKDSVPFLSDVVRRNDQQSLNYARRVVLKDPEATLVRNAALVLGTIGRADGIPPLLSALTAAPDNATRAIVVRELAKLPAKPETLKAHLDLLRKIPRNVDLPTGEVAVSMLGEFVDSHFDASVVDALIRIGNDAKGTDEEVHSVRDSLLVSLIHLMKRDQVDAVQKALNTWAPQPDECRLEKEAFAKSKEVVVKCAANLNCYLDKVTETAVQDNREQIQGIKAAYMVGVLGWDPASRSTTRAEIVKRIPLITNPAIKFSLGRALDHLAPEGDRAAAEALQALAEEHKRSGDAHQILGDHPLKQIALRLLARL